MVALDAGSFCCCGSETFSVFGPHQYATGNYTEITKPTSSTKLLGTVYYQIGHRFHAAPTKHLYTIADTLEETPDEVLPDSTVTTWGGDTLYILSGGSAEKVDLSEADAKWWVTTEDIKSTCGEELLKESGFRYEKFSLHEMVDRNDGVAQASSYIGTPIPTGAFWENPAGHDISGDWNPGNPEGEYVGDMAGVGMAQVGSMGGADWYGQPETHSYPAIEWMGGYSDEKLGLLPLWKQDLEDARKVNGSTEWERQYSHADPTKVALPGFFEAAESEGGERSLTFQKPGKEIKLGWRPGASGDTVLGGTVALESEGGALIQTDANFCVSDDFNAPTKVSPLRMAENSWPFGAGGYTISVSEMITEDVEYQSLSHVSPGGEDFYSAVGGTKLVSGINTRDSHKHLPANVVDIWPPRRDDSFQYDILVEGVSNPLLVVTEVRENEKCFSFTTHEEVAGAVHSAYFSGSGSVAQGDSTGGNEGSSYTAFTLSDVGKSLLSPSAGLVGYAPDSLIWHSIYFGSYNIKRKLGLIKTTHTTYVTTGSVTSAGNELPHIAGGTSIPVSSITEYHQPSRASIGNTQSITLKMVRGEEPYPWADATSSPVTALPQWSYYTPTRETSTAGPWGRGRQNTRGIQSYLRYYNRTATKDVFVVETEADFAGMEPPKFYRMKRKGLASNIARHSDYADEEPREYWEPATPWEKVQFIVNEGAGGNYTLEVAGNIGTSPSGDAESADCEWTGGGGPTTGESLFKATINSTDTTGVKAGGFFDLGYWWDARGSDYGHTSDLPFSASNVVGYKKQKSFGSAAPNKRFPYRGTTQLWFAGHKIYDSSLTVGAYNQTMVDLTDYPLNKHVYQEGSTDPVEDGKYFQKLGYPRTRLDSVEVLPGDRLAVLTTHLYESGYPHQPGQRLTVFNSSGVEAWSVEASHLLQGFVGFTQSDEPFSAGQRAHEHLGYFNRTYRGSAVVTTASDRWLHITGFPLDVYEHSGKEVPAEGKSIHGGDKNFRTWLMSLADGSIKVPGRVEDTAEVYEIRGKKTDSNQMITASWADLTASADFSQGNFDAARDSTVIDTVKKRTMHPNKFF